MGDAALSIVSEKNMADMPEDIGLDEIVDKLRQVLGWLDMHAFDLAAIHVNDAIEVLKYLPLNSTDHRSTTEGANRPVS